MPPEPHRLDIRKYPNRRFYDATRSRHVTLSELHELVGNGHELSIQDSRNGQDITNLVLTQILIERDADKLALLPSEVLHQIIRTQASMMGSVFEGFMRQIIDAQRSSQEQWNRFMQNTLGLGASPPNNPFDWSRALMDAFRPPAPPANMHPEQPEPPAAAEAQELTELRRQLQELTRRVEGLGIDQRQADAPPADE